MDKMPTVSLTLKKVTGLVSSLEEIAFTGPGMWIRANQQLCLWRYALKSGVDEVDFRVCYQDGCQYQGTIELVAAARLTERVGEHMRLHCETYGGRRRPDHLSEEEYVELLRVYRPEECTRWLDCYEIGE